MKKLPKPKESSVHYQVAQYLKNQYPKVIFRTDFAAGIRMTMGQAMKHKSLQAGRAYPDLFIAEARSPKPTTSKHNPQIVWYPNIQMYHGLFLELKREGVKLKKRDGTWKDEHIKEQAEVLSTLREKEYCAEFAIGFDEAKRLIDEYLN